PAAASGPSAAPEILVDGVSYPEGPALVGKDLYFVEYGQHRVVRWREGASAVFWQGAGDGPAGLLPFQRGFLVAAYARGGIVALDASGGVAARIDRAADGSALDGPNDFCLTPDGGIYVTCSGKFEVGAPVAGRILYSRDGRSFR